jgi:flagellar basal-body rod modification protein FlgD
MTTPISAVGAMTPYATGATSTTDPTTTTGATTATGTSTSTGSTGSTNGMMLDPQAFLQLLVAQLKYQDPSNPVDTSSFMNQTAMLSQVQTMNSMSSTMSALVSAQQAQAATGLIGKHVTYLDTNGMRVDGVVSAANLLSSGATLQIDGATVALASVVGVNDGTTTSTTTTTS